MSKRVAIAVARLLSVVLIIGSYFPVAVSADTVSENAAGLHAVTDYKNTYMDVEEEVLEEDRKPRVSGISSYAGRNTKNQLPRSYRSDQVSENGIRVSYLPEGFRNQKPYGTCWAFSALGACEASLIRKGLATGSVDLSERHLAYYFFNKGAMGDSKGGTYGDYNVLDKEKANMGEDENYLDAGGNSSYTMWQLAGWCGPVEEARAPYDGLLTGKEDEEGLLGEENSTAAAYEEDAYHVQNVYKIALGDMETMASYKQTVKKLIMEYGALAMSYYSSNLYDAPEYDSYYNYRVKNETNHAIQVVGWDDDFPKENFGRRAPGDGAWLMKNSWGDESEELAQNGFFWISYYDLSVNAYNNGTKQVMRYAYVFDAEPADNYDNIYQYDGDSMSGWITLTKEQTIANCFTVKNDKELVEAVRGVGIGVAQSGVAGTVEIYTDRAEDTEDPTSGTKVLSQEFSLEYPGYHTIKLEQPVYVENGQEFAVVFRFDQETQVNLSYDHEGWVTFFTYENPYVSYWKDSDGEWSDLADEGYIFRIKAYTDETENKTSVLTGFRLSHAEAELTVGESLQLTASQVVSGDSQKKWEQYWSSSDDAVATVSGNGEVTAVSQGEACIKVYNGNVSADCKVVVSSKTETKVPTQDDEEEKTEKPVDSEKEVTVEEVIAKEVTVKKVTLSSVALTKNNRAKLKWKKQTGVAGYQIFRACNLRGTYQRVKTIQGDDEVTITLASHIGLKPYYYKVRAFKVVSGKRVYGAFSEIKSCGPAKTDTVKAKALKGKRVKISWSKAARADGYRVFRSTEKYGVYKRVASIPGNKTFSYVDCSLKKGKTYYYRVRAYRQVGEQKVYGPRSDTMVVKIKK